MGPIFFSLLFPFLLPTFTAASKILVFSPTISRSHMISNGRVADALAKDGHNVTLLEVEYVEPVGLMNASKVARTLSVPGAFFHPDQLEDELGAVVDRAFRGVSLWNFFFSEKLFQTEMNAACERFILTQRSLLDQLKDEQFDLIFAEQLNFCGAGLAHLLNIGTHILLSSCPIQEHVASLLGLPNPASYVPSLFESNLPDKMTIYQRFTNILLQIPGFTYFYFGLDPLTQIFRKHFGVDFPDLRDIVKGSPFVFVSVDELVDFPRPTFSNILHIGGLGMGQTDGGKRQLPEPFNSLMVKGANGVVYFSFGTFLPSTSMPEEFRRNIFQAFSQLPDYQFIVKIEKDDNISNKLAEKLTNVFVTPWIPQAQLLLHPRMRLFITHGGYNSLMEAARAGIPLICMGFFADQYRNARVAERNGWGMAFEKRLLLHGSSEFEEAMLRMMQEPKYTASAKRTQKLVLNKPFSAEERLLKSIRFLELSGGKLPELLSESRNMDAIALYNLDLVSLFVLVAILFVILLICLMRLARRQFIHIINSPNGKKKDD